MVKGIRKRWPRKESSVHTLHPFLAIHLAGMLGASWQRQVSIYTPNKAPLEATFSHYKSPKNHKAGHNACFMTSFIALSCCFHTHSYTVEWAKYSRKRAPSTLTLSWKSQMNPQYESLLLQAICYAGICDLWRRGIQSRVRDKAWLLGDFCVAVLLKYLRASESFWHRHQKGTERVLPW